MLQYLDLDLERMLDKYPPEATAPWVDQRNPVHLNTWNLYQRIKTWNKEKFVIYYYQDAL